MIENWLAEGIGDFLKRGEIEVEELVFSKIWPTKTEFQGEAINYIKLFP